MYECFSKAEDQISEAMKQAAELSANKSMRK